MNGDTQQITLSRAKVEASSVFLAKVFNWMTVGLGVTGVVAYLTVSSGMAVVIASSFLFFLLIIAEFGLVFYLSSRIEKLHAGTAVSFPKKETC